MPNVEEQKTETKTTEAPPLSPTAAPLMGESPLVPVKPADLDTRERIEWSAERIQLMKRKLSPPDTTDDEFAIFLEQCKRSQMDPLMGEADLVERWKQVPTGKRDGAGDPIKEWVVDRVFQPREQGMEARADRFDDFIGMRSGVVRKNDKNSKGGPAIVNPSTGEVDHVINVTEDRGPIIGAWAVVHRRGRVLRVAWVKLEERKQKSKAWYTMEETMILKCAEMAAHRKAYPNTFGGMYIEGEIDVPERDVTPTKPETPEQHANGGKSRTDRVAEKVVEQARAGAPPADQARPPPPGEQTVDAPKASPPQKVKTKPGHLNFGAGAADLKPHLGKPIAELDGAVLRRALEFAAEQIAAQPMAKWRPIVEANVEEIKAEQGRRFAQGDRKPEPATAREPGSDDAAP